MARVLDTWRSWSVRRRLIAAGLASLVVVGGAVAAYMVLKRPEDVVNRDASFRKEREERIAKKVDWPLYGYTKQRTRYLPAKDLDPPFGASEWSLQLGKLLEFSPIFVGHRLFFMDKNAVFYSVLAGRGKVEWKRDVGGLNASAPAYSNGRLFAVNLTPGQALALRARDGKVLWRHPFPGRTESSPIVYKDTVIVGNEPGQVVALDVRTGRTVWQTQTAGPVKAGLALDKGVLYGGNYAGEVFAIRASNGHVRWKTSTLGLSFGRGGSVYSTPAVAYGRVYLGSIDGRVYSFEQSSGDIAWTKSTGAEVYPAPAVADPPGGPPTVYIGSQDQSFYALDAKTGDVRWQKRVGGHVLGAASVVGHTVYVSMIGPNVGTLGYDADNGQKVFEHEVGEYNPVISDGRRIYLTGASVIRAFEPRERKPSGGGKGKTRGGKHKPKGDGKGRTRGGGGKGKPRGGRAN